MNGKIGDAAQLKGRQRNLVFNSRPAQAAKGMLAFGIFITHGLSGYVAIDITWKEYVSDSIKNHRHKTFLHYIVRTSVIFSTCE